MVSLIKSIWRRIRFALAGKSGTVRDQRSVRPRRRSGAQSQFQAGSYMLSAVSDLNRHRTISRGTPSNHPKLPISLRVRIGLALGRLWLRAAILRSHIVQRADELWPQEPKPPGFANACIRFLQPFFSVPAKYIAASCIGFAFVVMLGKKLAGLTDSLYAVNRFTHSTTAAWLLDACAFLFFLAAAIFAVWIYFHHHEINLKRAATHVSAVTILLFNSVIFFTSQPEHILALAILLLAEACAISVFFRHGFLQAWTTVILAMAYTQGALIGALAGTRFLYA